MPLLGIPILLDIICAIHIYKTGRPYWWLAVVLMAPVVGAVAYLLFEVLPTSGGSRQLRRVIKHFDPGMDFRARLADVERCGSVQNKAALADECINGGQFDDAIRLYHGALTAQFEGDITLQYGLATAYFWKGDAVNAVKWLDTVILAEPWHAAGEAKLLKARALAGSGDSVAARSEYELLLPHFGGEEARAHYAAFLAKGGQQSAAQGQIDEIKKRLRLGNPAYRRDNRTWLGEAEKALAAAQQTASAS
jgi:hypothetical protein